jgi:hypothetical protein
VGDVAGRGFRPIADADVRLLARQVDQPKPCSRFISQLPANDGSTEMVSDWRRSTRRILVTARWSCSKARWRSARPAMPVSVKARPRPWRLTRARSRLRSRPWTSCFEAPLEALDQLLHRGWGDAELLRRLAVAEVPRDRVEGPQGVQGGQPFGHLEVKFI